MDWKEIQETTKALTGIAAQKINEASDLAAVHLQLKMLERRRKALYEAFGEQAYLHFTTDGHGVEEITKFVEAITLANYEIEKVKKELAKLQAKKQ